MGSNPQFQRRAAGVKARLGSLEISHADAARGIGYQQESGISYVRQVLNGLSTSNVVLDRIEDWLEEEMSKQAA